MSHVLDSLAFLERSPDFVELVDPHLHVDLRYASTNNFLGRDLYGPFRRAYLHRLAAEKLFKALADLRSQQPAYRFIVFDALRPRSIQRELFAAVEGTPQEKYLAKPEPGSLHNFGFAVDLSILDGAGVELDMGAGFDDFRDIAQPQLERNFLESGQLSEDHLRNRHLLRGVMERAGFTQLPHEWWHFDAMTKAEALAAYKIVE